MVKNLDSLRLFQVKYNLGMKMFHAQSFDLHAVRWEVGDLLH